MARSDGKTRKRAAVSLGEIVGRVLDPVAVKRGFATADLISGWPDIVGERYADCTAPQKISWPRGENGGKAGTLVLAVDGPRAVLIQHELGQIIERINAFFGYGAISQIRLVQGSIIREPADGMERPLLGEVDEARLNAVVDGIESAELKASLERLGRGVLTDNLKKR